MNTTIKKQVKEYGPRKLANGDVITAEVRHDDGCGNGHNTYAVTASICGSEYIRGESSIEFDGHKYYCYSGGCCHDEVAEAFPELAPLIKWHLCSTDGPMHYIENAKYWAGQCGYCNGGQNDPPNEVYLKSTIIYGAVEGDTEVDPMALANEDLLAVDRKGPFVPWLESRLPALLAEFREAVESLGLTF
jgi:hypothetical protein